MPKILPQIPFFIYKFSPIFNAQTHEIDLFHPDLVIGLP